MPGVYHLNCMVNTVQVRETKSKLSLEPHNINKIVQTENGKGHAQLNTALHDMGSICN